MEMQIEKEASTYWNEGRNLYSSGHKREALGLFAASARCYRLCSKPIDVAIIEVYMADICYEILRELHIAEQLCHHALPILRDHKYNTEVNKLESILSNIALARILHRYT